MQNINNTKTSLNTLNYLDTVLKPALYGFGVHECADIFPMMSERDIVKLSDDIRENGQLETIKIFEGKIIDGRHRYMACLHADIEPKIEHVTVQEPIQYVSSLNQHRRHMNETQRA